MMATSRLGDNKIQGIFTLKDVSFKYDQTGIESF